MLLLLLYIGFCHSFCSRRSKSYGNSPDTYDPNCKTSSEELKGIGANKERMQSYNSFFFCFVYL
jgi:hypothetical protein